MAVEGSRHYTPLFGLFHLIPRIETARRNKCVETRLVFPLFASSLASGSSRYDSGTYIPTRLRDRKKEDAEQRRGGGGKDTFPELQRRRELTLTRISVGQVRTYFNARAKPMQRDVFGIREDFIRDAASGRLGIPSAHEFARRIVPS